MFIRNIQEKREDGQYKIQAEVELEARNARDIIFFSVPAEQAHWIRPEPHAFMVGTAMAAMWNGETRMEIERGVDPQLSARLSMAMRLMSHWHKSPLRPVKILAPTTVHPMPDTSRSTTELFLSGGVDSLAALYWNTTQHSMGYPRRVGVAFFVHGLDVGDPNKQDRPDVWELGIQKLSTLCHELGVELVTIKVNLRNLAKSWGFYAKWQFASLLSAIAHAASSRIHRCIITSDNVLEYIEHPHGSHPWLNGYFGTDFLEITTGDMEQFSRLERIRLLTKWPGALDSLRVCWDTGAIPIGHLNCGRCAKCVRTMLEFPVCDQLTNTQAFPQNEVTPDMLKSIHIRSNVEVEYFVELISPLEQMGRADLAAIIKRKLWLFQTEHALNLNYLRPIAKKILGRSSQNLTKPRLQFISLWLAFLFAQQALRQTRKSI